MCHRDHIQRESYGECNPRKTKMVVWIHCLSQSIETFVSGEGSRNPISTKLVEVGAVSQLWILAGEQCSLFPRIG
jgi:hypothetical protein